VTAYLLLFYMKHVECVLIFERVEQERPAGVLLHLLDRRLRSDAQERQHGGGLVLEQRRQFQRPPVERRALLGIVRVLAYTAVTPFSTWFNTLLITSLAMPPLAIIDAAVRRRSWPRKSATVNVAAASDWCRLPLAPAST
jgi:hypothetical protein